MANRPGRPRIYPPICLVPECNGKHRARGFCDKHYGQWRLDHPEIEKEKKSPKHSNPLQVAENHSYRMTDEHGEHWIWTGSHRRHRDGTPRDMPQLAGNQPNLRVALWEYLNGTKLDNPRKQTIRSQPTCPNGCVNPDHLSVVIYTGK